MELSWPLFLRSISQNQSMIARAAGVNTGTVSRWMSGQSQPKAEQVIAVARAYGESPLVALYAAGYLQKDEMNGGYEMPRMLQLKRFTDVELAREILARIEGQDSSVLDEPVDEAHVVWHEGPYAIAERSDAIASVGDHPDDEEDFDVTTDVQKDMGLAAKRGERKVDQPHAE
ncbi:helix-turn-helix domain-containing protein [Curtobacterium sp. Csp2]|uniref:helix-turn-helix domain-containing protein n=1 Tax=Curtobacterium sp. Csp2 TaxID=2495430 RepID=UPI002671DD0D|nr:helix-turn-helix transcriptional regulator [Curtobacterium sp. Csp2]